MKGFTKDKKFHPITDYKKVRKSRDTKTKTQGVVIRKAKRLTKGERAKQIMNKKLDDAGVGQWYRQLHVRDRATIFDIFQSRTKADVSEVRFDLLDFPLEYADQFVEAVVDWRVARQNLSREHEETMIKGLMIKQRRAEVFKGVSLKKLEERRRELGKDPEKNKEELSAIDEELHQRYSGLVKTKQRLNPIFPSRGSPEITPTSTLEML